MEDELHLPPLAGARYALSRKIGERWVHLVQDTWLEDPQDAEVVLYALHISITAGNLDHYFPERPQQGRCPTLELLELFYTLGSEGGIPQKKNRKDGV